MRGAGVDGATGAAGRAATGAAGGTLAETCGAAGAGGGGGAGRAGGVTTGAEATGVITAAGFSTGGAITGRVGAGAGSTATGAAATGAAGAGGLAAGGATAGFVATGAAGGCATGRAGGAVAASFCCVIAFRTSPGREICERSILVLIPSSPRPGRVALEAVDWLSAAARKWARTFSASKSSRELEWVFFSVTPTAVSTSRMALLLTSSSRARSLIRTLLIRPFFFSALLSGLHS